MFNNFHHWRLFGTGCAVTVGCFLSFNITSGDLKDLLCKDDEEKGLCLYEGWFYTIDEVPETTAELSCQWVEVAGEPEFVCTLKGYTFSSLYVNYHRYTYMVHAETRAQRHARIVAAADNHIVQTVTSWQKECESFLKGGPVVEGYGPLEPNGYYEFTVDDCEDIIEVYNDGLFAEPANGSRLTSYKVVDLPDADYYGRFFRDPPEDNQWVGRIHINFGKIEEVPLEGNENRNLVTNGTVAHERVHLSDWLPDGDLDWILSEQLHKYTRTDKTYRWGEFIGEKAGPLTLYWGRMCLDNQISYYLEGWGHYNELPAGYCLVGILFNRRR